MTAVLLGRGLSKWYGQVIAVNKVSFSVGSGVTGLLGPNGAGKSTLMKLITGQLRPSQGELTLFGERIWNNYPLFKRIGFCPEQDSFYERMTGEQFLRSLLLMQGFAEREAQHRSESVLERLGLRAARDKRIAAYSKGMRQRIKLAQAMAHDPEVLVLDEPLAGMDPVARRDIIGLVQQWGRDGKCVIVSSHVLHELEAMTDNIILIQNGQVLAEGDVHEIRNLIDKHPHNISVRCSDPRRLAQLLIVYADVASITFQPGGGAIKVETRNPDEFYERLPDLLLRNEIDLEEFTSPDDNLEAVFQYLVR